MSAAIIKAIVTVLAGAMAGGLTNTVAIWMLFHPYRPPSVAGRRLRFLHGAIPKNQPRLASAIGRAVGTRLLTEEDLTRVLRQPEFREAFDEGLSRFLHDLLDVERGSLGELLGPEVMKEVDAIVNEVLDHTADRIGSYVHSEAFEESVEGRAGALADLVADEPVGDLLTPAREARITESAEEWIDGAVTGEAFREMVGKYVRRGSERLLTADLTVQDVLPPGVSGTLERAVEGYVPLAIQRLGSVLDRPAARKRIERAVKDVLHRFMHDLKFHQRVVARLVMTEDTVKKVLRTLEVDGAERIRTMLGERPLKEAMARGIGEAIADLLSRPMNEVFGNPDDDAVIRACGTIESWIVDLARDPASRTFVTRRIEDGLSRASSGTWGELIGGIPPERISEWVVRAARSEIADKAYRQGARALATAILERPIGRPGRFCRRAPPEDRTGAERAAVGVDPDNPAVCAGLDVAGGWRGRCWNCRSREWRRWSAGLPNGNCG